MKICQGTYLKFFSSDNNNADKGTFSFIYNHTNPTQMITTDTNYTLTYGLVLLIDLLRGENSSRQVKS